MNESKQMEVKLVLYHDQSHLNDENPELLWCLHVNGSPFPHDHANILESHQINKIVGTLVDLEEQMSEPEI